MLFRSQFKAICVCVCLLLSALSIGFVADAQIHAACVRWVLLQPLLQELHVQDTFGPCCGVFRVLREVLLEWFRSFKRLVEVFGEAKNCRLLRHSR